MTKTKTKQSKSPTKKVNVKSSSFLQLFDAIKANNLNNVEKQIDYLKGINADINTLISDGSTEKISSLFSHYY